MPMQATDYCHLSSHGLKTNCRTDMHYALEFHTKIGIY